MKKEIIEYIQNKVGENKKVVFCGDDGPVTEKKYNSFSIPILDLENMELDTIYCLKIGKTILGGEKTKAGKGKHYNFQINS